MRSLSLSLALVPFLLPTARAQTVLHTFNEAEAGAGAGDAVAIWDDLNGDGFLEWVVGAPGQNSNGADAGRVTVLSGADHSVLHTFDGGQAGAELGRSLANIGDVNADGVDDLAVGASGEDSVWVFSGADYSLLWSVSGAAGSDFGWSVAPAGLVNADGVGDLVVGAPRDNSSDGSVRVYSGAGGGLLFSYASPTWGFLGWSVSSAGDTNGDGFDDVLAGAPRTDQFMGNEGGAVVLAGPAGGVLASFLPNLDAERGQEFGYSVALLDDIDDDGVKDYAIGSRWYGWIHYVDDSWVGVFSGATHQELWRATGLSDTWFGYAIANAGDLDLDGYDDLYVSDPHRSDIHAFSPARDVELFKFDGSNLAFEGTALAGGADVDGDGWLDGIYGESLQSSFGFGPGSATLFTWGCPPDAVYNYCTAVANTTGQRAQMHWQNTTSVANNNFRLSADKCPANKPGLFFYGTTPTELPAGEGHLCVTGSTFRLPVVNTGPTGTPSHTVDFTSPPNPAGQISAGETWYFSFWFRDPTGGPAGFNFSDGLKATFCP